MKRTLWMGCLGLLLSWPVRADLVLVASADSGIPLLSHDQVVNIFLGRYRKLPDGATAEPLDIDGDSPERREFYERLLGKPLAEINAYWARLVFSGRTLPPEELPTQRAVLARVIHDPVAIGYVERANLNAQVKVVYEFDR
ncbi:MAG: hypothetical protein AB1722_10810 [Pseudomonadota bacterium]